MSEFNEFDATDARLATALRTLAPHDSQLDEPPADLWDSIDTAISPPAPHPRRSSTPHSRQLPAPWLAAAAAVIALAVGCLTVVARDGGDQLVAQAALSSDGLTGAPSGLEGRAEVREQDGRRVLVVKPGSISPRSGEYLEVWLIDTAVNKMVSLGVVAGSGEFAIPDGLDVTEYPIVDISTEPFDGKPTHSGASLLRGKLA